MRHTAKTGDSNLLQTEHCVSQAHEIVCQQQLYVFVQTPVAMTLEDLLKFYKIAASLARSVPIYKENMLKKQANKL